MGGLERGPSRRDWRTAGAIIAAGIGMRLAWLFAAAPDRLTQANFEPRNVAIALARSGSFADAFAPGSGPTAHLSPVMPLFIGLVYRVAGVGSRNAELLLSTAAIGLESLAFLLGWRLFVMLGTGTAAAFAGLAVVALTPVHLSLEVLDLRVWEAPLAVAAVGAVLLLAVRADAAADCRRAALIITAVAALLFIASPPASLAAFAVLGVLVLRRIPPRRWPVHAAVATILVGAAIFPWALRNHAVFDRWILTRSNAGLELALAYNDTMAGGTDGRAAYLARLAEIHPAAPGRGLAALRAAGGETAYYDALGRETRGWIARHPGRAIDLLLRHVRQYLVPPAWMFGIWGRPLAQGIELRRLFLGATMIAGLATLLVMVFRDRRYLYLLAAMTPLILPYIVVQPILRYRYLVWTLTVFLAVDGSVRVLRWLRGGSFREFRRSRTGPPALPGLRPAAE